MGSLTSSPAAEPAAAGCQKRSTTAGANSGTVSRAASVFVTVQAKLLQIFSVQRLGRTWGPMFLLVGPQWVLK